MYPTIKRLVRPLIPSPFVGPARRLVNLVRNSRAVPSAPAAPPPVPAEPSLGTETPVPQSPPAGEDPSPPDWEYCPQGFETPDCPVRGWNVESVLETQLAKWPTFRRLLEGPGPLGIAHEAQEPSDNDLGAHNTIMTFAYVLARAARGADTLSVLDWGGGLGHYGALARALLPEVGLDYHCKDVPVLCKGGTRALPWATFHDTDACLGRRYDLVVASSSLHYSQDWKGVVRCLTASARSYLFIMRLPVVRTVPSFAVLQRPGRYGYLTEYLLGWFLNRGEFLGHASELGLELCREFLVYERPPVPGVPEQCEYQGFLFRPKLGIGPVGPQTTDVGRRSA